MYMFGWTCTRMYMLNMYMYMFSRTCTWTIFDSQGPMRFAYFGVLVLLLSNVKNTPPPQKKTALGVESEALTSLTLWRHFERHWREIFLRSYLAEMSIFGWTCTCSAEHVHVRLNMYMYMVRGTEYFTGFLNDGLIMWRKNSSGKVPPLIHHFRPS